MNAKFYELPIEKQKRIKYAGYKVFGENTYKKASMKYLADEAGISKALVFHYFRNKMTLYQWLFDDALKELNVIESIGLSGTRDFFDLIKEVSMSRLEMMDTYHVMYRFVTRVFSDAGDEGHEDVYNRIQELTKRRKDKVMEHIDRNPFKEPSEISVLYDMINDLANGYYQRMSQMGVVEEDIIEPFLTYLDNIKRHYYKEDYL